MGRQGCRKEAKRVQRGELISFEGRTGSSSELRGEKYASSVYFFQTKLVQNSRKRHNYNHSASRMGK